MRCREKVFRDIKLPELRRLIKESLKGTSGGELLETYLRYMDFDKVIVEKCEDTDKKEIRITMFPSRVVGFPLEEEWYEYKITVRPSDRAVYTSSTEYPLNTIGPFQSVWARIENEEEFRKIYRELQETWDPNEIFKLVRKLKAYEIKLPI